MNKNSKKNKNALGDILRDLKNPQTEYRGLPFWSWNDQLSAKELQWQIGQMKEAGLGGFFMHARAGLKTPYMGETWMECVETCIEECRSQDMGAWLYDENGYPSGFAGGGIPRMGTEYCQKFLKMEVMRAREFSEKPETLGIYHTGGSFGRIQAEHLAGMAKEQDILHVWYETNPYYADLLDEKVVKAFIDSTYEVYYQRFKEYFGKEMPGIFTDEPQYGRVAMPWSDILPEKFHEMYGYNLLDCISALYFKIPNFRKVRYDFWNLVEKLFTRAVSRQLAQWCEKHNCMLTGHVLLEEDMRFQTKCSGSAMGFYRYMQLPGIDWLGRRIGNPVIVKQVSSVAEQLGRKRVLSEMFACSGWGATLEDFKHIAEWQYVLGVNLMCTHLAPYSLRGVRKKDHPPAMFFQSNWWGEAKTFNDYFSRLGMLLAEGEYQPDILVVHPLRSAWIAMDSSCYTNGTNAELKGLDDSFAELSIMLSGLHLDYHYGDEEIIAEYGSIRNGEFVIGKCSYKAVIIPPSLTLEPATVKLLRGFAESGGKIFVFDQSPNLINGVESDELRLLMGQCTRIVPDSENIYREMVAAGCKKISIIGTDHKENFNILHRITQYEGGKVIYLVNTDKRQGWETDIVISGSGNCSMADLQGGSFHGLECEEKQGKVSLHLSFAPSQSYVLVLTDEQIPVATSLKDIRQSPGKSQNIALKNQWKMKPLDLNVFVLDYCKLSLDGGKWSEIKPVAVVQSEMLELGRSTDIALEFTLDCRCGFDSHKKMFLILEGASNYHIVLNGKKVENKISDWWKDKSFHQVDISGLLVEGRNTLVLGTHFFSSQALLEKLVRAKIFEAEENMLTFDSEVENICIRGEFEVHSDGEYVPADRDSLNQHGSFYLDALGEEKQGKEAVVCGFPFYTGSMLFEREVEIENISSDARLLFSMERPLGAYTKLFVNSSEVCTFLWAPYEVEILPWIKEGRNTISLQVVSTDRNLFGPHHHPDGELYQVGPRQFNKAGGWTDSYSFIRFGMGTEVRLTRIKK